jgi:cyclophilin family peptidyl-prolyl cis-trans isomerase
LSYDSPPALAIDPSAQYTATITTNLGDIVVGFFANSAPQTVNNFLFLAQRGFYDGVIFHRVIPGFMIQGGDPTGTGRGGPGYSFADELTAPRSYDRGIMAMANSGPNTNGSQFFIMHETYGLPYSYTIFGEVTAGIEVVDAIAAIATGPRDRPTTDVVIESISVAGP